MLWWMLLASIGLYCAIQGKVKNDIASLFHAGMALPALSLVLFLYLLRLDMQEFT